MSDWKIKISRRTVGIIAIVCIATAGGIWFESPDSTEWYPIMSAGLIVGIVWIAFPTFVEKAARLEVSPKALVGIFAALVALAVWPKLAIVGMIVLAILRFVLRPRDKSASRHRSKRPPG